MTIAEVDRAIKSRIRVSKIEAQEKASYDYILANLITRGVSIVLGSKESYPTVNEAYPGIFDDIQRQQEKKVKEHKMKLSALRFKQFAQSYNDKYNKGVLKD